MGNSASNPANGGRQLQSQRRNLSPSPAPGTPHRSMQKKKNSLQLPDLASLNIAAQPSPPPRQSKPTQSIPIPTSSTADPARERGRVVPQPFSSTDLLDSQPYQQPRNNTPYYKTQQQQAAQRRIQEIYNQSNVPAAPPPADQHRHGHGASPGFKPEIVKSSIPMALQPKVRVLAGDGSLVPVPRPDPVPVKIVWKGGGHNVLLARAGDDDWKGRRVMERESPGSPIFDTTVHLLPGTHHIRFLVDDQWRVADDLPTAVDDQGSLANYVAVPHPTARAKDPSFFAEGSDAGSVAATAAAAAAATSSPPPPPRTGPNPAQQAQWTNILPPELLEAFKEEEMYLAANQGSQDQTHHHPRVSGFVPAPNIPPAPALPRHLDKLILNQRISPGPALSGLGNVGPVGNAASVVPSAGGAAAAGSGQARGGRRDRAREERREERRRGRERGYSDVTGASRRQPPPPPPPSEVGEVDPAVVDPVPSTATVETITESEAPSTSTSTAATTPGTPSTPVASGTPVPSTTPVLNSTAPAPVASRALMIDPTNMPPLTDDASVLAVPSHVVLHHLCTSAIRNGVLAVATTTRYRKKYLTTVFYKPT